MIRKNRGTGGVVEATLTPPIGGMDGLSALPVVVRGVKVKGASVRGVNVLPALVFCHLHVVHRGHRSHAFHAGPKDRGV